MSHTPGPWVADHTSQADGAYIGIGNSLAWDKGYLWIASVHTDHGPEARAFPSDHEGRSNALLVAAAPDLLKALEKIVAMNRLQALHQYGHSDKAESWGCVVVAREAIAKATGGAL